MLFFFFGIYPIRRLSNLRRIYADAIASAIAEDEERVVQEKNLENLKRQEQEETLTSDVVSDDAGQQPQTAEDEEGVDEETTEQDRYDAKVAFFTFLYF